ncbi:MAG TPA: GNAT family N-acetyltransferase [Bryobacteraceae bacterium]|nr:GNAT family N-acetyltransferase [Bryobacteraceae bacterium]
MSALRQSLKKLLFGLLGKDPEAVVVSFLSGDVHRARAMAGEFRGLVPQRRHFVVEPEPGNALQIYFRLRRRFRRMRIGQAAVLFDGQASFRPLRLAAFLLAPGKILAYNAAGERHHLSLRSLIASWLFLRGTPLDRIFLRPWWLCPWKRDRSTIPSDYRILEGRPLSAARPRVAVLSPYFPYPLSHGGAVRIYHLLREAARRYDIFLFAFTETGQEIEPEPVLELCVKVVLVPKPRYREPRWSSLLPPEVHEYRSPVMRRLLAGMRREFGLGLVQVEYTQLASYDGDILVEHDVTFDLYQQIHRRARSLSSWWDLFRWRRFERRAIGRYRRVVVMSGKDKEMLAAPNIATIPNGVDLERFRPKPEPDARRLLFIGSFRHFPNVLAFRFLAEEVWPLLKEQCPDAALTAVAGPDPLTYWQAAVGPVALSAGEGIRVLEFVRDVRPLYAEANLVVAPTLVSAGTNVKVLEAMAMERAVVSTSSGCAGLGLEHGKSVWIADSAEAFASGIARLLRDTCLRTGIARAARQLAESRFDWRALGLRQRSLWAKALGADVAVREAGREDLERIAAIQAASPEASSWAPENYLGHQCLVAVSHGRVAGFVAYRRVADGEFEILNLAVATESRRQGVAAALVGEALAGIRGSVFLEVRASNLAARNLYEKFGFSLSGLRRDYYTDPPEDGIVMRFQSC